MHRIRGEAQHWNLLPSYYNVNPRGHRGIADEDVFKIVVPHFLLIFDLATGGTYMHEGYTQQILFDFKSFSKNNKSANLGLLEILINTKLF